MPDSPASLVENRKGLKFLLEVKKDLLGVFIRIMREKGSYAWLQLGTHKVLMLNDAKGIEHVFKGNANNYRKSKFYKVLYPILGNSILLSEGEVWKKQRKESSPTFTPKSFDEAAPQMVDAMEAMFRRWELRVAKGEALDFNFETMLFALDVLLRTLFHETKENIAIPTQKAIVTLLREAEERVWAPVSLPQWLTFLLPKYRKSLNFLNNTIQELQDARLSNQAYPEDLLSRLIAGYGKTPQEQRILKGQIMTFLVAGHETTANGLAWACYYLSKHPEIWRRMEVEVDRVLDGLPPTLNNIKELTYCRQVFDEVLRFHPVVWTMSRDALNDDKIPLEDGSTVDVAKGVSVMLCTYAVHHRECYWKNPEVFDPERFHPETARERPAFAYFPFGGGPRQCLGIRFAQIESVIMLAMMAQRYRLSLVPGQNVQALPNITLRPNGPVLFKLERRKEYEDRIDYDKILNDALDPHCDPCPYHQMAKV